MSKTDLGILDKYAELLDSSIKIPGTERTIGLDPILGLIPGVGDLVGYAFSCMLLYKTVKMGTSKKLVLKMLGNITLDATIGAIPVLGSLFDFIYKANDRNVRLLREYHDEGKHHESSMPIFLVLAGLVFVLISTISFAIYKLIVWIF